MDTISVDLNYFTSKFVEKGFIARAVSDDITAMYGVGAREKASSLLQKILVNLKISQNKQQWFLGFVAIFSGEVAYSGLANTLMIAYPQGIYSYYIQAM